MADGESDGFGFDLGKRAHMAAFVEQGEDGLVAGPAHRLVEEAALHRIVVDDETTFAHAATPGRTYVPNWGTVADHALTGRLKLPRGLNLSAPHIARDFEYRAATAAAISRGPG